MTKVTTCGKCRHSYQDRKYGVNKRVHNSTAPDGSGQVMWRCTVCTNVKGK